MLDELAEKPIIEKTRYKIPAGNGLTWEIDEFHGVNEGLIVAEIEVPSEDTSFEKPDWLGEEVSFRSSLFQFQPRLSSLHHMEIIGNQMTNPYDKK